MPAEALRAQSLDFRVVRVENRAGLRGSQRRRTGVCETALARRGGDRWGHGSDHQPGYEARLRSDAGAVGRP
jgi:hypothetical protein